MANQVGLCLASLASATRCVHDRQQWRRQRNGSRVDGSWVGFDLVALVVGRALLLVVTSIPARRVDSTLHDIFPKPLQRRPNTTPPTTPIVDRSHVYHAQHPLQGTKASPPVVVSRQQIPDQNHRDNGTSLSVIKSSVSETPKCLELGIDDHGLTTAFFCLNVRSERTALSPTRKLSAIAPKQTRSYSLPALTDIVPLGEGEDSPERVRHGSYPGAAPPRFFIPGVTTAFIDGLPVQSYVIVGKPYTMQKPDNEGTNECIRITVDNRRLKYVLNVLQQPQKARACGNGPRASSDRRPVDPPPVVQLKVFDITEGEKDVTMNYDSGFMLYGSLEVARPIANGRMHSPPHPPVLTGVAVASAAYLERPNGPSGYFIFPDLSVRHEGWYRLKFSLFEAVKHPQDADCDRPFSQSPDSIPGRESKIVQHQSMANRMEVSSTPFQVFSAKKFPGLEMSTDVSVALAQQGCRVRIRRDIRQRKRAVGDKSKRDHPSQDASNIYAAQQHTRNQSLDSQYRDLGQTSIDSQYTRPTPSRHPSIASMTQSGPSMSLGSRTSISTHQPQRPSWDSSPIASSTYSSGAAFESRRPVMTQPTVLPPLPPPPMTTTYESAGPPKQYDIPMPTSQKRSYSPAQYNQTASLKQGARPDNPPPIQSWHAPTHGGLIEVDDGEDSDIEYSQYFTFRKSDKSYGSKSYLYPNGMDRLLHRE
ncbi:hypothetical protein DV738_g2841, partial [Chaetothyriales sp. CBS 135597]